MKTADLTGAALDWAVAKCEGVAVQYDRMNKWWETTDQNFAEPNDPHVYAPTIYWEQGGPIIEREEVNLERIIDGWRATTDLTTKDFIAPTPLIAAMRCYVASKFGDEVELPEELQ